MSLRVLTAAEQVANHLREEIRSGSWTETMPGGATLARELGVGRMTVDAALDLLEQTGELVGQGGRRPRRISSNIRFSSALRIAVLPYLPGDYRFDYILEAQRQLQNEGHGVIFPPTSIVQMKQDLRRIVKLVEDTKADAWIIVAGTREVLTWFAESSIPAFALFGRRREVPLAGIGPDKTPALIELTRHLIDLGHERICMLTRPMRRLPKPGGSELAFLEELEKYGIPTGAYNLPDWDGQAGSLPEIVETLFGLTPPTAMIIDEPPMYFGVQHLLARRGILAPEQVSLACTDWDPYFAFQKPSVAHLLWDSRPWVRRIVKWVGNVSQGKTDTRQSRTLTKFVPGGSIGTVPNKLHA